MIPDQRKELATEIESMGESARCEAIKQLGALRLELLKQRRALLDNPIWKRFDEYWQLLTAEMKAMYEKIEQLAK